MLLLPLLRGVENPTTSTVTADNDSSIRVQLYHTPRPSIVKAAALYYRYVPTDKPVTITTAVGNADGTVTASGVINAAAREVGNADGTVTASGVIRAAAAEVGNADGTVTATGSIKATAKEVGNADGTVTVSGSIKATAKEVGNADGTVTVAGEHIEARRRNQRNCCRCQFRDGQGSRQR